MKKQFAEYSWLAGSHGRSGSLWQGPDHLLVVEARGLVLPVSELYRRVDYKNIQVLTLRPTARYIWLAILTGLGAGLFSLLTWNLWNEEPILPITLGIPAVLLMLLFVVHLVRGRSCVCTLQTAVQVLTLKPLNRMRTARPVMLHLESLCREHQQSLVAGGQAQSARAAQPVGAMPGVKAPWSGSGLVLLSGLLTLLWGVLLAGEFFVPSRWYTMAHLLAAVTAIIMTIVSLVRLSQVTLPPILSVALWGGLGVQVVSALGLYVMAVVSTQLLWRDETPRGLLRSGQDPVESLLGGLPEFRFDQTLGWGWAAVGLGAVLVLSGLAQLAHSPGKGETPQKPAEPPPLAH